MRLPQPQPGRWRMKVGIILTVVLILGALARAEDLFIVVHPATALGTDLPVPKQKHERRDAEDVMELYGSREPQVVVGKEPKDAPDKPGFILMLEPPRNAVFSSTASGYQQGTTRLVSIPYKGVVVVEPFSLWHRAAASAKPVQVGGGFYWSEATPIDVIDFQSGVMTFRVLDLSINEMIHNAVRDKFSEVPRLLADAWSPNVIKERPILNATPEKILEWGKHSAERPYRSGGRGEPLLVRNPNAKSPGELAMKTTYKPSRVLKNADGSVVFELDLSNRLPVAAHGVLKIVGVPRKNAPSALQNGKFIPENVAKIREVSQRFVYAFHLAPGQKDIARFTFPADAAPATNLLKDVYIEVEPLASYLGPEKK